MITDHENVGSTPTESTTDIIKRYNKKKIDPRMYSVYLHSTPTGPWKIQCTNPCNEIALLSEDDLSEVDKIMQKMGYDIRAIRPTG